VIPAVADTMPNDVQKPRSLIMPPVA
jgi:hypothetical protein